LNMRTNITFIVEVKTCYHYDVKQEYKSNQ